MKITHAYVYKWTELSSGRWYIGSRTKIGCHPDDSYICSSKVVIPLIKTNPAGWKRDILCIGHPMDMLALETNLLLLVDAKNDPLSYNMHNGDGKFTSLGRPCTFKGKKLGPQSAEAKMKRSIALKGKKHTAEHRANNSAAQKGREPWNKGKTGLQVAHNKGTRMSEEQKQKIRETKKMNPRPAWNKGLKSTPEAEANRLASRAKNRQNKSTN